MSLQVREATVRGVIELQAILKKDTKIWRTDLKEVAEEWTVLPELITTEIMLQSQPTAEAQALSSDIPTLLPEVQEPRLNQAKISLPELSQVEKTVENCTDQAMDLQAILTSIRSSIILPTVSNLKTQLSWIRKKNLLNRRRKNIKLFRISMRRCMGKLRTLLTILELLR